MNRDHSTVWHGCRQSTERMKDDAELRQAYISLKARLSG
jgi:chromosomal replication initiation ATPase DnaA